MSLPTRKIGNDQVSEIGFGAMGISSYYGSVDLDEERLKVFDAALETINCSLAMHPSRA
ncbi:hypothetical protein BDQ17DRAFT_1433675 [Cyathus striatus]|nr:hypothetical protein BDQ17DRAFT_1433675 [Cyathus striatus]